MKKKIHLPSDYLKLERPDRLANMLAIMKNSSLLFCDLYMHENNFLGPAPSKMQLL
jgi:hypothetical protein